MVELRSGARRSRTVRPAVTTAVALLGFGAAVAVAAPAGATSTTTTPMTSTYVVGEAPGHVVAPGQTAVVLNTGAVIAIPTADRNLAERAGVAARNGARPADTVYGSCGSSYITVKRKSNGQPVHMDTGFTVIHDAISYSWDAQIAGFSGSGYEYSYHADGNLAFDSSWHGQHSSDKNYRHGTYHAHVLSPSYAMLDDGDICVSGDPYDYANL